MTLCSTRIAPGQRWCGPRASRFGLVGKGPAPARNCDAYPRSSLRELGNSIRTTVGTARMNAHGLGRSTANIPGASPKSQRAVWR